jgi:hypothetical protein
VRLLNCNKELWHVGLGCNDYPIGSLISIFSINVGKDDGSSDFSEYF